MKRTTSFARFFAGSLLAAAGLFGFAASILAASAAQETKYAVNGYWRLGYNTSWPVTSDGASQAGPSGANIQGYDQFGDLKTSRHARNPSYFWLKMTRLGADGTEAAVKVDHTGTLPHENGNWGDADSQILRVRDLYLQLPLQEGDYVWAGARYLEWEDIRLFDFLNPFNVNAHGVGAKLGSTQVSLSATKKELAKGDLEFEDAAGAPATPADDVEITANQKVYTAFVRHEMPLGDGLALRPMLKIEHNAGILEDEGDETLVRKAVKATTATTAGGVLSRWGDGYWGNTMLWVTSAPSDATGKKSGSDLTIGLGESSSYTWDQWGVLFGVWMQQETYKDKRQVFKVSGDALVADGDKTTKSTLKTSLGAQPVYYVTERFQTAIDVNYAFKTQKTSDNDYNATLVTPIIRYAMNKTPLGTPQIYTSVTHGTYDWKAKEGADGKPTKSMITTQTGFETWF